MDSQPWPRPLALLWCQPGSLLHASPFFLLLPPVQVHVNLLILEARLQAELLYALRAITHYMVS